MGTFLKGRLPWVTFFINKNTFIRKGCSIHKEIQLIIPNLHAQLTEFVGNRISASRNLKAFPNIETANNIQKSFQKDPAVMGYLIIVFCFLFLEAILGKVIVDPSARTFTKNLSLFLAYFSGCCTRYSCILSLLCLPCKAFVWWANYHCELHLNTWVLDLTWLREVFCSTPRVAAEASILLQIVILPNSGTLYYHAQT